MSSKKAPLLLISMSTASVLLHLFFLSASRYIESTAATVLLELWPVGSFFVAMFFVSNKWDRLDLTTGLALAISVVGLLVVMIPYSETSGHSSPGVNDQQGLGFTLAILAAVASSATILQVELARRITKLRTFASAAFVVLLLRLGLLIPLGVLSILLDKKPFSLDTAIVGMLFGLTTYGLASILAIYGIRYATNLKTILLWFITPALGLLWLTIFFAAPMQVSTFAGFVLILLANGMLNYGRVRRTSLTYSAIVLVGLSAICFLVEGSSEPEYLQRPIPTDNVLHRFSLLCDPAEGGNSTVRGRKSDPVPGDMARFGRGPYA